MIQYWKDGTHGPASKGQEKSRHLTDEEEVTLCEWILCAVEMGEPMSKQALHAKAAELSKHFLEKNRTQVGKKHLPSNNWVYRFLDWNPQLAL